MRSVVLAAYLNSERRRRFAATANSLFVDATEALAVVRDRVTLDNVFRGDINDLLVAAAPPTQYLRDYTGLLVADTVLRSDYDADGNALGILIEGARTNRIVQSENLTLWPGTAGTLDAAIADPTGATGTVCYGSSPETLRPYDGENASTAAFSFFTKARSGGGGDAQIFQFYQSTGGGDGVILLGSYTFAYTGANADTAIVKDVERETWLDGWYRFKCRLVANAGAGSGVLNSTARIDLEGGTYRNYVWGVQIEPGYSTASSYIPTHAAAATRVISDIKLPLASFPYRDGDGVLLINGDVVTPVISGSDLDIAGTCIAEGVSHLKTLKWTV